MKRVYKFVLFLIVIIVFRIYFLGFHKIPLHLFLSRNFWERARFIPPTIDKYFVPDGKGGWASSNSKEAAKNGMRKSYHLNGKLSSLWHYRDGKAYGEYKMYDEQGRLYEEGVKPNYRRDYDREGNVESEYIVKDGIFQRFEYGKLDAEGTAIDGYAKNCPQYFHREYFDNGNIAFERHYAYGKEHGKYTTYHRNGNLSREAYYEKGQYHGWMRDYDKETKKLKTERLYDHGVVTLEKSYHDGVLYSEKIIKDGIVQYRWYRDDGSLERRKDKKALDPSDKNSYTIWVYDGQERLEFEETYRSGEMDGECKYYDYGVLATTRFYKKGFLIWERDYRSKLVPKKDDSLQQRVEHKHDDQGRLRETFVYDNNEHVLEYYQFRYGASDSEIIVIKEIYYENGSVKEHSKKSRINKNIFREIKMVYNDKGQLLFEETYHNDNLVEMKSYNEDGTLRHVEQYDKNGELITLGVLTEPSEPDKNVWDLRILSESSSVRALGGKGNKYGMK